MWSIVMALDCGSYWLNIADQFNVGFTLTLCDAASTVTSFRHAWNRNSIIIHFSEFLISTVRPSVRFDWIGFDVIILILIEAVIVRVKKNPLMSWISDDSLDWSVENNLISRPSSDVIDGKRITKCDRTRFCKIFLHRWLILKLEMELRKFWTIFIESMGFIIAKIHQNSF